MLTKHNLVRHVTGYITREYLLVNLYETKNYLTKLLTLSTLLLLPLAGDAHTSVDDVI